MELWTRLRLGTRLDVWMTPCGSCDCGLPTGCSCPTGDPRPLIMFLVSEIERLETEVKRLGEVNHRG